MRRFTSIVLGGLLAGCVTYAPSQSQHPLEFVLNLVACHDHYCQEVCSLSERSTSAKKTVPAEHTDACMGTKGYQVTRVFPSLSSAVCSCPRPTKPSGFEPVWTGERIQFIGGNINAPGAAWQMNRGVLRDISKDKLNYPYYTVRQATIGSVTLYGLKQGLLLTPGAVADAPDGEAIFVYSARVGSDLTASDWRIDSGFFEKPNWFEDLKAVARGTLILAYGRQLIDPESIRDVSAAYRERLRFWPGQILAFTYKAIDKDYLIVHAFLARPGPTPTTRIVADFSFLRTQSAAERDHFEDFAQMLKSIEFEQ